MIGRPGRVQLSWVSDIGLSLTWQWLHREDHAFLPSNAWIRDKSPGSVKLLVSLGNVRYCTRLGVTFCGVYPAQHRTGYRDILQRTEEKLVSFC